jgi:hypothetical protein
MGTLTIPELTKTTRFDKDNMIAGQRIGENE